MAIQPQMSETDKFMENFDPSLSNREKRKKMRHQQANSPTSGSHNSKRHGDRHKSGILYDDQGFLLHNQADCCDCLRESCPGCHFPCPKCRSPKCGIECRVHRRWMLETVSVEGTDLVVKNEHLPGK